MSLTFLRSSCISTTSCFKANSSTEPVLDERLSTRVSKSDRDWSSSRKQIAFPYTHQPFSPGNLSKTPALLPCVSVSNSQPRGWQSMLVTGVSQAAEAFAPKKCAAGLTRSRDMVVRRVRKADWELSPPSSPPSTTSVATSRHAIPQEITSSDI